MEPRKSEPDRTGPVELRTSLFGTTQAALSAALRSMNRKKMPLTPKGREA